MLFSVLIPVYNSSQYLRECLDSIFDQRAQDDVEVICVDDGSTDESLSIIQEYAVKAESLSLHFSFLSQENQGLGAARNRALEMASGEWIWFVDSDDWILPNSFERLRRVIGDTSKDIDLVWFNGKMYYEKDGQEKTDVGYNVNSISGRLFYENYSVVRRYFSFVCSVLFLYRREFLLRHHLFFKEGIFHEDCLFVPQVCFSAKNVCVVDDICYVYRYRSSGSIVSTPNKKRVYDMLTVADSLMDLYYRERSRVLANNIITIYFDLFRLKSIYGDIDDELKRKINWDFVRSNRFLSLEIFVSYLFLSLSPSLFRHVSGYFSTFKKGLRKFRRLAKSITEQRWSVGLIEGGMSSIMESDFFKVRWVEIPKDRWYADPFVLNVDEQIITLLVEDFSYSSRKGVITLLEVDRFSMTIILKKELINLPTHLSFPNILRKDDRIFIYPENSAGVNLGVYEYSPATKTCTYVTTICDESVRDSDITCSFGAPLLFTAFTDDYTLDIFRWDESQSRFVPWESYVSDIPNMRLAGSLFEYKGKYYLPMQNQTDGYGSAIDIKEVKCERGIFCLNTVKHIKSPHRNYRNGCHTLNEYKGIVAIDVLGYRYGWIGSAITGLMKMARR